MSIPPVSTTMSWASTTTPMIDIWSSRLVMLVAPQKIVPRVTVAMRSRAARIPSAYWPLSQLMIALPREKSSS